MTRDPKDVLRDQWMVMLQLCEMVIGDHVNDRGTMDIARRVCWSLRDETEKAIKQIESAKPDDESK